MAFIIVVGNPFDRRTRAMSLSGSDAALVVVDVQNDFFPGGPLAIEGADEIVPVINRLMTVARRVAAIQEWHPRDHVSFASNHKGKKPGDVVDAGGVRQTLWPDHGVQMTRGAEFHPWLDARRLGLVLRKGARTDLDATSAFLENDGKTATGLAGWLSALGVKQVYVCGIATASAVRATALDARKLGLETIVVEDACRGFDEVKVGAAARPGGGPATIAELKKAGVKVVRSAEVD
jgi:nicotinamidase/pyrazinamidase